MFQLKPKECKSEIKVLFDSKTCNEKEFKGTVIEII